MMFSSKLTLDDCPDIEYKSLNEAIDIIIKLQYRTRERDTELDLGIVFDLLQKARREAGDSVRRSSKFWLNYGMEKMIRNKNQTQ